MLCCVLCCRSISIPHRIMFLSTVGYDFVDFLYKRVYHSLMASKVVILTLVFIVSYPLSIFSAENKLPVYHKMSISEIS